MATIYFGKNLTFLRKEKGLEQQDLANMLNIPRSTLACWETGKRVPKIEQMLDICDFFNINLTDLVQENLRLNSKEKK